MNSCLANDFRAAIPTLDASTEDVRLQSPPPSGGKVLAKLKPLP
jgi:hypothetical protein